MNCASVLCPFLLLEDVHAELAVASTLGADLDTTHEDAVLSCLVLHFLLVLTFPFVDVRIDGLQIVELVVLGLGTTSPQLLQFFETRSAIASNIVSPDAVPRKFHLLSRCESFRIDEGARRKVEACPPVREANVWHI